MPTPGQGAVGSLDYTDEERKKLAKESVDFECTECGKVLDLLPEVTNVQAQPSKFADEIKQLIMRPPMTEEELTQSAMAQDELGGTQEIEATESATGAEENEAVSAEEDTKQAQHTAEQNTAIVDENTAVVEENTATAAENTANAEEDANIHGTVREERARNGNIHDTRDYYLDYVINGLVIAIFYILYQKLLRAFGIVS